MADNHLGEIDAVAEALFVDYQAGGTWGDWMRRGYGRSPETEAMAVIAKYRRWARAALKARSEHEAKTAIASKATPELGAQVARAVAEGRDAKG